jgi:predicted HAD superfamily Cof-like phosphohydrolase
VPLASEFHIAFGVPIKDSPTIPDRKRVDLRWRLLNEEFQEVNAELARITRKLNDGSYADAIDVYKDVARLAKELSDLRYVIEGCELEFGIDGEAVAAEVHRSNMSKLGADGSPSDGMMVRCSRDRTTQRPTCSPQWASSQSTKENHDRTHLHQRH